MIENNREDWLGNITEFDWGNDWEELLRKMTENEEWEERLTKMIVKNYREWLGRIIGKNGRDELLGRMAEKNN